MASSTHASDAWIPEDAEIESTYSNFTPAVDLCERSRQLARTISPKFRRPIRKIVSLLDSSQILFFDRILVYNMFLPILMLSIF